MFITTIVMMLVLAVALTTSSLAWFSASNASVTASSATFKAQAASSNVNLKISKTPNSWGNSIKLASGNTEGSMDPLIPTAALVPTYSDGNYIWNSAIVLNGASASLGSFVIDDSNKPNVPQVSRGGSNGFYYDYFYIHNADAQTSINELYFEVQSQTKVGEDSSDTACRAYAAIILFNEVQVEVGGTVPSNAALDAGKTVVANDADSVNSDEEVKANLEVDEDYVYQAWVPFAAFSYSPAKATYKWQYADFNKKDADGSYTYNNIPILGKEGVEIPVQEADSNFATTSSHDKFTLNSSSLKELNSKSGTTDSDSSFVMSAGATFRVDFYYWLDGLDLDEFKDDTTAEVSIEISAPSGN